jgi:integrase/recombinase XerD
MTDQQLSLMPNGTADEQGIFRLTTDTSLKAAIGAFKKHMQYEGFSQHTIQAFTSDLNLFGKYLGIGQPIGGITTDTLNDFLKWMLEERGVPCSPKTYARRVTTLKVFFKWLFKGGVLLSDPAAQVIQRSVRSPLPAVLSEEEIEQLRAVAEGMRQGDGESPGDARPLLLLELLLQTGAKKGEIMGIVPNHIERSDPDKPVLFIRYRSPAKRYKERKVPLETGWLTILDEYLEQYNPPETLITCTPRNLEYILHDLQESAGVNTPVSFECLRWTSAVHSHLKGIHSDELRRRMGLSEITWRETYSKIKRLAEALQKPTA